MSPPIRVLIADDHAVVREGLAAIIARRPDMLVVGEAADGVAALAMARAEHPDVLLVDLRMPRMGGVELIAAARQELPGARSIVLTTYDGDEDIVRALRAGAWAYLLKDSSRDELIATIRAVHAGERRLDPDLAASLVERTGRAELTARELEVLAEIARGAGNRTIGARLGISEGTVKTHVVSLLAKLGAADRTEAVVLAYRRGILRLDAPR